VEFDLVVLGAVDDGGSQLNFVDMIKQSLRRGARTLASNKKALLLYYVVNLLAAAVVVAPVAMILSTVLGQSLESERLFGNFDADWMMETLLQFHTTPAIGLLAGAVLVAVLYLLTNTFLAGGAIAAFARPGESFFAACARYFPRFFRIFLISLLFYGVVFGILRGLSAARSRLFEDSMRAAPEDIATWCIQFIGLLLLFVVNMTFDYAKIICVIEDRKALRSTFRGARFSVRHLGSTYALFVIAAAVGIALLAIYHLISEWIGQGSVAAVIAVFILRQVYITARFWVRLWTWGSELALFRDLSEQPALQEQATAKLALSSN
jgi:hypothetical protein